jgi:hypothetical protein
MKSIYTIASELRSKNVKDIFNALDYTFEGNGYRYTDLASAIMEIVAASTDSYVKDICERFNGIDTIHFTMSDKQRWCIAFAFQKVSDEIVNMVIERAKADAMAAQEFIEEVAEVVEAETEVVPTISAVEDIRRISENVERKQVWIHLHSTNKPIVRTIEGAEIHHFTNLRSHTGIAQATAYIFDLINNKYPQSQCIGEGKVSREEEIFFARRSYQMIINS